jgi:hypothetical protein
VIDFHAIGHVSYTGSFVLEAISQESHFVTSFHQALSELVAMSLDSTKLGEGEICTDQNIVLRSRMSLSNNWLEGLE